MSSSHSLKILFISRSTLYHQPGGDTIQVEQTAHYLRQLGCTVDIYTSGPKPASKGYDLIHFFNLIRPFDVLPFLKQGHPPLFTSSIYIDYSSAIGYSGTLQRFFYLLFGKHNVELAKAKARWLKGKDRFPGFAYLLRGHKKSIELLLRKSKAVLAASEAELTLIRKDFKANFRGEKISLGTEHIGEFNVGEKQPKYLLCASRIEAVKNQLNLIRAVKNRDYELTLAGKPAANQPDYYRQCKAEAGSKVFFPGQISQDQLKAEYAKAKVHALPSFFETTGLSSLEALLAGCQIVISDTAIQREIFGSKAQYCQPDNPENIFSAIEEAAGKDENHSKWVKENFSWRKSAEKILNLYREFLTNNQT